MSHSSFTTFDLKEKKSQMLVVVLLVLLLPILLYLLQQALSIRGRAAGETRLKLVPKNIAQAPDGTWKFTKDQEVEIDVVLESGTNQIESVEPVIFYDKDSLSLKSSDSSRLSNQNLLCSDFTPLKHKVSSVVGGLTVDQNGTEQGTEFGFASIGCTIYPPSDPELAETPPPAGFSAPVATFKFTPKQITTGKTITFGFTPGSVNDSSAYKYEGGCCSETNVLQIVENLTYDVVEAQQDATLAFSPSSGTYTVGQEFQVQVNLSTGQYAVDAVDAIIDYDSDALELVDVGEGTIFPSYIIDPEAAAAATGQISIGGQINPASPQGFSGNNQLFATLTFKALKTGTGNVNFYTDPDNSRNDTNIVQFRQGVDVLASVINASYSLQAATSPTPTLPQPSPTPDPFPATLKLSPTGGNQPVGQPFTVNVSLTTGTDRVDSVDAIISYDTRYLRISNIVQNSAFESESNREGLPNPTNYTNTVTLIHHIGASSSGITGSDLPLAQLTFEPLQATEQTPITIVFGGNGERNDSNVVKFRSSVDLLGHTENANFGIVASTNNLVESIHIKIALQGRPEAEKSKQKEMSFKIEGTHFQQNPITLQTDINGEASVSSQLENRITKESSVALLLKPRGYLQQRVVTPLINDHNTVDVTNRPFKAGDLDNSGFINNFDWLKFLRAFSTPDPVADITGDGLYNSFDNTYILLNWFAEDEQ